mgnify:CR=1 FL=1
MTVRDSGFSRDTPTAVVERDWLLDADTVTEGMITPTLLAVLVCNEASETLTVRDGGGVFDTPTPVAFSPCVVAARIVMSEGLINW